jgi:hypothetical protein
MCLGTCADYIISAFGEGVDECILWLSIYSTMKKKANFDVAHVVDAIDDGVAAAVAHGQDVAGHPDVVDAAESTSSSR